MRHVFERQLQLLENKAPGCTDTARFLDLRFEFRVPGGKDIKRFRRHEVVVQALQRFCLVTEQLFRIGNDSIASLVVFGQLVIERRRTHLEDQCHDDCPKNRPSAGHAEESLLEMAFAATEFLGEIFGARATQVDARVLNGLGQLFRRNPGHFWSEQPVVPEIIGSLDPVHQRDVGRVQDSCCLFLRLRTFGPRRRRVFFVGLARIDDQRCNTFHEIAGPQPE